MSRLNVNAEGLQNWMNDKDPKGYLLATLLFIPWLIGFLYFCYRMIF